MGHRDKNVGFICEQRAFQAMGFDKLTQRRELREHRGDEKLNLEAFENTQKKEKESEMV